MDKKLVLLMRNGYIALLFCIQKETEERIKGPIHGSHLYKARGRQVFFQDGPSLTHPQALQKCCPGHCLLLCEDAGLQWQTWVSGEVERGSPAPSVPWWALALSLCEPSLGFDSRQ